jgi:PAS domain S-box-containing protein
MLPTNLSKGASNSPSLAPVRILVVEDEPLVARDIELRLKAMGYDPVGHATRGHDAVALATQQHPDLVLMDIQLSGAMDGIAAAQAIRTQLAVPVVFLTAFADDDILERAKLSEPFGYLLKPYSSRELRMVIEMALYKHKGQTQLMVSEAFTRTILDSVATEIAVLDHTGLIVAVNQPWRDFALKNGTAAGMPERVAEVGSNYLALCRASANRGNAGAQNALQGILSVLNGSLPRFQMEYACETPPMQRWFGLVVTPWARPGQGVVTSHRDITDQKIALSKLSLSESLLRRAQEISLIGNFSIDTVTNTVEGSAMLFQIFGLSAGATYISKFFEVVHPDHRVSVLQSARASIASEDCHAIECDLLLPDGSVKHVHATSEFAHDPENGHLMMTGVVQDVTARRQTELALAAAKDDAEKANKAKSRFLAASSHDLSQPLSALSLYVGLLKNKVSPELKEIVRSVQACVDSMTVLLTDFLDMNNLEAGVVTPRLRDFPIDNLIDKLIAVYGGEARLKNLELRWNYSNAVVYTDPHLLQRIAGNLIANAIRYTSKGSILISCRHHLGKQWLEVQDTGIGIPADKTEYIFEEYSQLASDGGHSGSGLGLAIVKKTAALLGLQLRLSTTLGKGSLFAIELPPARAAEFMASSPAPLESRCVRIGLVEDNDDLRRSLTLALQSDGHEVIAATTPQGLIDGLNGDAPDVVISDYRLGAGLTGYNVISLARATFGNHLPVLIITGDTHPGLIRSMADRGIAVMHKPLQLDELQRFVAKATQRIFP